MHRAALWLAPLTMAAMLSATPEGVRAEEKGDAAKQEGAEAKEEAVDLPTEPEVPRDPGVHHVAFRYNDGGEARKMSFGVYLPERFAQSGADAKLPMVVFLSGVGERGQARKDLYANGPIAAMVRHKALKDHLDFVVLSPQCPRDKRWKSPGMERYVIDLIGRMEKALPIDPDRVYLTGLSMGGTGTWHVARAAPEVFAAIAPICGRPVDPDATAEALAGVPTWIIVGGADRDAFVQGAERMRAALDKAGGHVRKTVVPGVGHGVWPRYYRKPAFYQWLLQHRRGKPVRDLHTDQRLLRIAHLPAPNPGRERFERKVNKQFNAFAPHWFIDNCGRSGRVGHHDTLADRDDVFVTRPLNEHVPCRLMFTADLAKESKPRLKLTVGAPPDGRWRLTVKLGQAVALEKIIDADSIGEDGWTSFTIDLAGHAGGKLPIQLHHEAVDSEVDSHAYWGHVEVVGAQPVEG